jgi:hypothetical protein
VIADERARNPGAYDQNVTSDVFAEAWIRMEEAIVDDPERGAAD